MMDGFSGIRLAAAHPKKRAGRKKFRETRHPVYRGVRQRDSGKWVCELRRPNKSRIWLGTFPTVEMAARAHDVAAMALRGPDACLNFADSAWRLPVPDSGDTRDIQRAAASAAEAFRPVHMKAAEEAAESTVSGGGDEEVFWMDEEDVFRRPELFADMYNGMMLPPPVAADVVSDGCDEEADVDLPLWSYSI